MAEQSNEMIDPSQESAISIQTISISNEIGRTTIQQEGQLIMFADATRYGESYQNQPQDTLLTMTVVSSIVNGEIESDRLRRDARSLFRRIRRDYGMGSV